MSTNIRSPNTKTLAEVERALCALSKEANGDGAAFRSVSGGRHGFVAARSKTHEWDLNRWGLKLAERCGCRVKLTSFGTDEELAQGHLDADTWSIDPDGFPMPFEGAAFDQLPGTLFLPKGWRARAQALGWARAATSHEPIGVDQDELGALAERALRDLCTQGVLPTTLRAALDRVLSES